MTCNIHSYVFLYIRICSYTDIYNCILPTLMCMYVEGERTQSYLLDIWYVCRERMYRLERECTEYLHSYTCQDTFIISFMCTFVTHAFIRVT